jgi:hypothetical protein
MFLSSFSATSMIEHPIPSFFRDGGASRGLRFRNREIVREAVFANLSSATVAADPYLTL